MATISDSISTPTGRGARDGPIARAIDRWIFVFMAASFIFYVLAGFIPDSIDKIAMVERGERPPFPLVLHAHAVLMGAYLLLLLAQTSLMAMGKRAWHMQLGIAAFVLAPAIVVVGSILVPTIYHAAWSALQAAPADQQARLQQAVLTRDNIMLLQLRIGILFPLFLAIGLAARKRDSGLHKRMMILSVAVTLTAGFARIPWLPQSMPASPLSGDLYTLWAVAPMFVWDLVRTHKIHRAYKIWLAVWVPVVLVVHGLWDTAWWHSVAPRLMGV